MTPPDPGSLAQFLNYGGLGLLAILCLVVLGYNVWSLNSLVARAEPKKINAAKPLLLSQMGLSLIGLLAVGFGALYLEGMKSELEGMKAEAGRTQMAQVILDPWDSSLDPNILPAVMVGNSPLTERPINVVCTPDRPTTVRVDFGRFIRHKQGEARRMQEVMLPITAAMGAQ